MSYLLDTNVVSEVRKGGRANPKVLAWFGAVDEPVAELWGRLNVPDPISVVDGLLAATALVHSMTLVTRNTRDVARTGVRLLNPFGQR